MAHFYHGQLIEMPNQVAWELITRTGENHWLAWRVRDHAVSTLSWNETEGWKIVPGREPWSINK